MTGIELRTIRDRLGWTQLQLADALGVASNTVARWERDELGMREPIDRLIQRIAAEHEAAKNNKPREGKSMKPKRQRRRGGP